MANDSNTITRLMSPPNAAKYLAVSERTLFTLTKTNRLPAVRIGRAVRYDLKDLDTFITVAKTESPPKSIGQILPFVLTDIERRQTVVEQVKKNAD